MANALNLHINNITQYEIDQLVKVFFAANVLCMVGRPPEDEATRLTLRIVPRVGFDKLSLLTFQLSEHLRLGKESADGHAEGST